MRYKLVLKNHIGSVEFSLQSRIVVENIETFTQQSTQFTTTQSNREIGEKLEAQHVKPKTFPVRGTILGASDAIRRQILHVIAPLSECTLIFDDTYEMTVYVKASPDVERYEYNARYSFSLYAPFPYWRTREKNSQTLVGLKALFSFPWNISDPSPFAFSEYVEVGYVTINNTGEAPASWTATLLALDEVVNPRIYNMKTGLFVRLRHTMENGETITISTEGEELSVRIETADGVQRDGFEYLDLESEPFQLAVGENYIKTDAENDTTAALRASIAFQPNFVGV